MRRFGLTLVGAALLGSALAAPASAQSTSMAGACGYQQGTYNTNVIDLSAPTRVVMIKDTAAVPVYFGGVVQGIAPTAELKTLITYGTDRSDIAVINGTQGTFLVDAAGSPGASQGGAGPIGLKTYDPGQTPVLGAPGRYNFTLLVNSQPVGEYSCAILDNGDGSGAGNNSAFLPNTERQTLAAAGLTSPSSTNGSPTTVAGTATTTSTGQTGSSGVAAGGVAAGGTISSGQAATERLATGEITPTSDLVNLQTEGNANPQDPGDNDGNGQ